MRFLILAATAGLALAVVAPADAGAPKYKGSAIVPGSSIGGVKVGMSKSKVVKLWGTPDDCRSDQYKVTTCMYLNASRGSPSARSACARAG